MWFIITMALACWASLARAEPPRNPNLASDWAMGHGSSAQAAFSARPGPTGQGSATLVPYGAGVKGTSPWLVETGRGALYGASLTHLFRYRTAPDLAFETGFQLTRVGSISWNIVALAGQGGPDLIIVPQPLGLRPAVHRGSACAGQDPALLVFEDRDGPLRCLRQIRFDAPTIRRLCGARGEMGYTASNVVPLWDGSIAVPAIFRIGGARVTYLVTANPRSGNLIACVQVGAGRPTNNIPVESLGGGRSALYVATDEALVRIDQTGSTMTRRWSVPIDLAERTGTTPTLVGFGRDRFVVLVEGICAVTGVFSGRIECSNRDASRLIWVRRDGARPEVGEVRLPGFIRTAENSPATDGRQVVIADYGGYRANPRAGGVVSLAWDGRGFAPVWQAPDVQMNGVLTISGGSGLVYSSGLDASRRIVARGLIMHGENAGGLGYVAPVGAPRRFLDRGVNTVILSGQRAVYSVDEGLVLLR
ncbi:hypothetical protein SLH49_01835 [Cognatiyoonia sp. IB215446]|uniref:hypothetical protein n=1 Tax=Cognatiyoonia sp. IB215446 TaxID=3097355 RepID=UPI002A0BE8AC|nr:hypothetical protein [Cognatiyoonia sp. IB215446]MDX8346714.1 hypothetical protein [Cognatiyoonia sp. IB215446]